MSDLRPAPLLTGRFDDALLLATDHHRRQLRKGTRIPYVSHLLAVASLVLEMGGSEDEAIGALLHVLVEDGGGPPGLALIRERFGDDVARIVLANTDTDEAPKPPWRARKEAYIAAIAHKQPDELRVSLADKLHNARAILLDYRTHGQELWGRFAAGEGESVRWYYRELHRAFAARRGALGPGAEPALEELRWTVDELDRLASRAKQGEPPMWRLLAGRESVEPYLGTRRAAIVGWTVAAQSAKGDLVLMYGIAPLSGYWAVARQCTDPVRGRDGRVWAWLQLLPAGRLVPQDEVTKLPGVAAKGSGLQRPAGNSANAVRAGSATSRLLELLIAGNERAGARVAEWRQGRGRFPRNLDERELRRAELLDDDLERNGELRLSQRIAERLVRSDRARRLGTDDRDPVGESLEFVLRDDAGGRRRADVLLISKTSSRPTLLLIEVKLVAAPTRGRDPLPQVLIYRDALERDHGDRWRVVPWIVAEHVSPMVVVEAERAGVSCSRCDDDGRLKRVLAGPDPLKS